MSSIKTRVFRDPWHMPGIAKEMRRVAWMGKWDGTQITNYFQRCHGDHPATGTILGFTRDFGHHTSGWWKPPVRKSS